MKLKFNWKNNFKFIFYLEWLPVFFFSQKTSFGFPANDETMIPFDF